MAAHAQDDGPDALRAALAAAGIAVEWEQEGPGDPGNLALEVSPGSAASGVLRINRLDSTDGTLALWEMVCVAPARAATAGAFGRTVAMLNMVNAALLLGKVVAEADRGMVWFGYTLAVAPGAAPMEAVPPVVALLREELAILVPALVAALTAPEPAAPDPAEVIGELEAARDDLARLAARLGGPG